MKCALFYFPLFCCQSKKERKKKVKKKDSGCLQVMVHDIIQCKSFAPNPGARLPNHQYENLTLWKDKSGQTHSTWSPSENHTVQTILAFNHQFVGFSSHDHQFEYHHFYSKELYQQFYESKCNPSQLTNQNLFILFLYNQKGYSIL